MSNSIILLVENMVVLVCAKTEGCKSDTMHYIAETCINHYDLAILDSIWTKRMC